jgi:hypothetical protein
MTRETLTQREQDERDWLALSDARERRFLQITRAEQLANIASAYRARELDAFAAVAS